MLHVLLVFLALTRIQVAAFAAPAARNTARTSRCGRAPQMQIPLLQKAVYFSELDEAKAVSCLRDFPSKAFGNWGEKEWSQLTGGRLREKLQFSTQAIDSGVLLTFYKPDAAKIARGASGSVQDGALSLVVTRSLLGQAIVARSVKGSVSSNAAYEDAIWQRLVLYLTKSKGLWANTWSDKGIGTTRGLYPCSLEKQFAYIDSRQASDPLWKRY